MYKPATPVSDNQFEQNRNNRAAVRDVLIGFINNISISDVNSIRAQASMLTTVTGQTDEITRTSAVMNIIFSKFLFIHISF